MIEFICILVLFACCVAMYIFNMHDSHKNAELVRFKDDFIKHQREQIIELMWENNKLRGECITKQADAYAKDCK